MTDTPKPPEEELKLSVVFGDSVKRLSPHSAINVNSNCFWLASQPFRSRMEAERHIAELAELRAYKAAYLEAMEWLAALHEGGLNERLDEFMRSEIESGRFRP